MLVGLTFFCHGRRAGGFIKYREKQVHPLALPEYAVSQANPSSAMKTVSSGLVLASLVGISLAGAIYTLDECVRGEGFYDSFNFENITDPTHGRVYVYPACARFVLFLIE